MYEGFFINASPNEGLDDRERKVDSSIPTVECALLVRS